MILNITTTTFPAKNLGFLLHKNPDNFKSVKLSIGKAHIFYPEASDERTTVSLLLDINPMELAKSKKNIIRKGFSLAQYVNDRPYVASSFMSVALAKAFSTAMNGTCKNKPELVDEKMDFEVEISVLHSPRGGDNLIKRLFLPLGYELEIKKYLLDEKFESWGEANYYTLKLRNKIKLKELLSHLYVLIPVLDNDKHYFVSSAEIEKLLTKGKGWLENHPEMEIIAKRYMIGLKSLSKEVIEKLYEGNESYKNLLNLAKKEKKYLNDIRLDSVFNELVQNKIYSVIDIGCGEGKLIQKLIKSSQFNKIAGMDVSYKELLKAKARMFFDEMAPRQKSRIDLFHGSIVYKDERLRIYQAATVIEVIEHLDEEKLHIFEKVLFEYTNPEFIIITTPNIEFNETYKKINKQDLRHHDHRFEWTREEFQSWSEKLAKKYNYNIEFKNVGESIKDIGSPTQMGIFKHKIG